MPECAATDFRLAPRGGATFADVLDWLPGETRVAFYATTRRERTLRQLLACRTPTLGGVLEYCESCAYAHPVYRSCGDRHCPVCQTLKSVRWNERAHERLLAVSYYHVVLTQPAELRPLIQRNQRALYGALFTAGRVAIQATGASRLDAQLGATAVLHTWNSRGLYHPHLHVIVTAGGLNDAGEWVDAEGEQESLLPLDRLRAEFSRSLLGAIVALKEAGKLDLPPELEDPSAWEALLAKARARLWNVYAKKTLPGAADAFGYVARYTTRVGITNNRIESFDYSTGRVGFRTKHGELLDLSAEELVRRFCLHILPKRFHRIRHWGLFASACAKKRALAREALGSPLRADADGGDAQAEVAAREDEPASERDAEERETTRELLLRLTGVDLERCPRCGGQLRSYKLTPGDDGRELAASLRRSRGQPP